MKIIPLADRVVIKTVEVEETTKGGLILTGSAKEKPQVCEVIAVGPGGVVDGKEVKMTVKVGDKVLTSKYSGTEVKVDGEECTIVRQGDILAVNGQLTEAAKPYFIYRRAKRVSLRPADGRGPIVATADGECAPCGEVTASLQPLAGRILLPKPAYERFCAARSTPADVTE